MAGDVDRIALAIAAERVRTIAEDVCTIADSRDDQLWLEEYVPGWKALKGNVDLDALGQSLHRVAARLLADADPTTPLAD